VNEPKKRKRMAFCSVGDSLGIKMMELYFLPDEGDESNFDYLHYFEGEENEFARCDVEVLLVVNDQEEREISIDDLIDLHEAIRKFFGLPVEERETLRELQPRR